MSGKRGKTTEAGAVKVVETIEDKELDQASGGHALNFTKITYSVYETPNTDKLQKPSKS